MHRNAKTKRSVDPTRTLTLRNSYVKAITTRFRKIKGGIRRSLIDNDALGMSKKPRLRLYAAMPPGAFQFSTSAEKMDGFMDWLRKEVDTDILEIKYGPDRQVVGHTAWQNVYIESAYKKGMIRANDEMVKAGIDPELLPPEPFMLPGQSGIEAAFLTPIHADRVGLLYSRNFSALKGITDEMDKQIGASLAESLAEGRGPYQAAAILNKRVDAVGIARARVLARTEIIRAHHAGMINTYREAGVEGVRILAELKTAGDDRVCSECEGLEEDGRIYTLDEAEGLIPVHPQCRCIALPVLSKRVAEKPSDIEGEDLDEFTEEQFLNSSLAHDMKLQYGRGITEPIEGLSSAESYAVRGYSTNASYKLNAALRAGDATDEQRAFQAFLNSGVRKLDATKGTYYRGLQGDFAEQIAGKKVGSSFVDEGFSSFSSNRKSAETFGKTIVKFEGSLPNTGKFSAIPGEEEFLMPSGTQFKVLSSTTTPEGNRVVTVGVKKAAKGSS